MKNRHLLLIASLMITVVTFSFGCAAAPAKANNVQTPAPEPKLTEVTKENLKARLAGKDVQFIESRAANERPNPLFLLIKIVGSGADGKSPLMTSLNSEPEQGVSELVTQLGSIFKTREKDGVFLQGKNEVDKRLNIAASDADIAVYNKEKIYVEDFEKLIDALHQADVSQIYVNFTDTSPREITIEPPAKN